MVACMVCVENMIQLVPLIGSFTHMLACMHGCGLIMQIPWEQGVVCTRNAHAWNPMLHATMRSWDMKVVLQRRARQHAYMCSPFSI